MGARLFTLALLLGSLVALGACSSRISRDNYSKIQQGMTVKEVEAILGSPTSSRSSTLPVVNISGTEYEYVQGKTRITLGFVNDKLVAKEAKFE